MNYEMRILIAYDGSDHARAALADLGRAGLPREVEALVASVADVWVPPSSSIKEIADSTGFTKSDSSDRISPTRIAGILPTAAATISESNERAAEKGRDMLEWASKELRAIRLTVMTEIKEGDPQGVLIDEAQKWEADSVFLGSRGFSSSFEAFRAGSVSTGLVTGAPCSVEIVRERRR